MQIHYELEINRMMDFIKKSIRSRLSTMNIEHSHFVSDLFYDFTPKRIFTNTNKKLNTLLNELVKEVLAKYPFLGVSIGYEPDNELYGILPYNLFQYVAGNYVAGEEDRLTGIPENHLEAFSNWINS